MIILKNEFSAIRIELNQDANGPRLKIEDLKSGRCHYFDPIEMEGLVWTEKSEFLEFMDPSRVFL